MLRSLILVTVYFLSAAAQSNLLPMLGRRIDCCTEMGHENTKELLR